MSGSEPPPETPDSLIPPTDSESAPDVGPYRVLARKYRPTTFDELIGQDVLVRTLTNAFNMGRLAHAFILTGVRGIGKTTTARIIARALNCIGPDGTGDPTTSPCGVCEHCRAIAEDRHVDILEMDAASRTGVDDIRELIDGVRYRPTQARYKVYIIDEVHMLSRNAFNALLKTLEEPPEHVKFVFATTEIRKVPVTVLSRCQRFDLSRVDAETLSVHFAGIAKKEGAAFTETALNLIVRAADGSVRDGLSLLDQAISQVEAGLGVEIGDEQVRAMLGLADRSQTFMLLEAILGGDVPQALNLFDQQYIAGADPAAILEDMLDVVHWLTRIKIVPAVADEAGVPEMERVRGKDLEARLKMPALARAWQMMLKGLQEVRVAPSARQATEMVLVRLAYSATLPTPEAALQSLPAGGDTAVPGPASSSIEPAASSPVSPSSTSGAPPDSVADHSPPTSEASAPVPPPIQQRTGTDDAGPSASAEVMPNGRPEPPLEDALPVQEEVAEPAPEPGLQSFADIVALAGERREVVLKAHLENDVHIVDFETGKIEFRPTETAPSDLAGRLTSFLNDQTNIRWVVTVSGEEGAPTMTQDRAAEQAALEAEATGHPLVKAVLETFPDATVEDVRRAASKDD
ncbi:MAG: DNA polymerase III subunit gamma/tau [Rhodospirillaceae bacterium]|nr:DNA polymerase III subunit gamma/tau [Rhodospirillaceae bacterium]